MDPLEGLQRCILRGHSNYRKWEMQIKIILSYHGYWNRVKDGPKKCFQVAEEESDYPTEGEDPSGDEASDGGQQSKDDKKNRKARLIILKHLSLNILGKFMPIRDCKDLWDALEKTYDPKNSTNYLEAYRKYVGCRHEHFKTTGQYISAHRVRALRLERFGPPLPEQFRAMTLINCLPPEAASWWRPVMLMADLGKQELTFNLVASAIEFFESKRPPKPSKAKK